MLRLAMVCFEDPRLVSGGVQRRVAEEIAYFAARGMAITVITEGPGSPSDAGGVRYVCVPTPAVPYPLRTLVFSWRASRMLKALADFDVVETHHDAGLAVLLAGLRPGLFVEVVHGVFRDEFDAVCRYGRLAWHSVLASSGLLPLSLFEGLACRKADAVVTVSRFGAEQVSRRYNVPRQSIHVISNGIDPRRYRCGAGSRTAKDTLTVVYVGRWHVRKGVLHLLRAFALAHQAQPRLRLRLIGGGPLESLLRQETRRLGLSNVVEFAGRLQDEDVISAYRSADLVCVPSLQEGQGIVALEAQACGAPVVATQAGGLAEAVCDGQTGILVPPNDIPALAGAILSLSENERQRRAMGLNAAEWARAFTWDGLLAPCERLYVQLLARRRLGQKSDTSLGLEARNV